ncbi:UDP-glycosyltransferase 91D1-like protein [Tanacetum coccineum]
MASTDSSNGKLCYEKILKDLKKEICCNGTIFHDKELGKVIQLQGDQKKNVLAFLTRDGIDIHYLNKVYDGLKPQVAQFLKKESPDWIIYDFSPYWLPEVMAGLGISQAYFSTMNAWSAVFFGPSKDTTNVSDERKTLEDFLTPPKWIPFPSNLCFHKREATWMLGSGSDDASGVSYAYHSRMILKGSNCIFIRYCYEFEPQWLTLLQELYHLRVVPIGLMPQETPTNVGDDDHKDDTWVTIKKWLDGQQKDHVVYVALGSEVVVNKSELGELVLGLELSRLPFFWAFRKPAGSTEFNLLELPDGFIERTRNRGMIWTSWLPQLQILGHESVVGFKRSSIVDAKLGIEVPRNDEDDSVARSLSKVVVDDEGKIYKAKAMASSKTFSDINLQRKYIDDFIDYLEKHRRMSVQVGKLGNVTGEQVVKEKQSSLVDTTTTNVENTDLNSYPPLPTQGSTPASNSSVLPVEFIRANSNMFVNTAYGFFLGKRVAYPVVANYGMSSYARAMIELSDDVELNDTIVVVMPKLTREGFYTCTVRVKYEWKPPRCACCKASKGVPVGSKVGFKTAKEYRPVSEKPTANTSGNKKKAVEPTKEVSNSNSFDVLNLVDNDEELGTNRGTSNLASNEANSSGSF